MSQPTVTIAKEPKPVAEEHWYPYGKVYIVWGTSSQLWWELRNYQDIELLIHPSELELRQALADEDPFGESRTIVVLPRQPVHESIPTDLLIASNTRAFILLRVLETWSGFNKDEQRYLDKLFKKLQGGVYKGVKLTDRVRHEEPEIRALLKQLSPEAQAKLCQAFAYEPQRLRYQLQQEDPLDFDLEHGSPITLDELFDSLLTPQGPAVWQRLPKSFIHALVVDSEDKGYGLWQYLTGLGYKKGTGFARCPILWQYLQLFLQHGPKDERAALHLFAMWIRLTNTVWADRAHPGLTISVSKGKSYMNFNPSPEAEVNLIKLLQISIGAA